MENSNIRYESWRYQKASCLCFREQHYVHCHLPISKDATVHTIHTYIMEQTALLLPTCDNLLSMKSVILRVRRE